MKTFKKFPIGLISLLVFSLLSSLAQADEELLSAAFIRVKAKLNLRNSESFRGTRNVIRTLEPGDVLSIIERTEDGHFFVKTTKGEEGFIFNDPRFIETHVPATSEANNPGVANATAAGNFPTGGNGLLMPLCGCTHARCRLTSQFGMRTHPISRRRKMHLGVDIGGPVGQPIRAAADGIVGQGTYRSRSGWGNRVVLIHRTTLRDNRGNTVATNGYETQYNHLHKILVKPGEHVTKGQIIGTLGSTGRSTGPHLDMNVRANGRYHDPMKFFEPGSIAPSRMVRNTTAACPVGNGNTTGNNASESTAR